MSLPRLYLVTPRTRGAWPTATLVERAPVHTASALKNFFFSGRPAMRRAVVPSMTRKVVTSSGSSMPSMRFMSHIIIREAITRWIGSFRFFRTP
jgi:hypothetical protein